MTLYLSYDVSGLVSCDSFHRLFFKYPIIFWTPRDRCSIAKTSAAHDRLVQKIALTAIVDQADNSTGVTGCWSSRLVATAEEGRLSLLGLVGRLLPQTSNAVRSGNVSKRW